MNEEKTFSTQWANNTLTIKTGKLAKQADAAVTVQYGETVVMATVVESKEEREGIDFFPLMVDLEERLYAAGMIKGSRWIKREGRPTDESVLTGRMIDRTIRPLFDESSRKEVQVILTVLSVDQENDHDIIGLIAASAALSVSGVNWQGPIGGIRVGRVNNELVFNPTYQQRTESDLDLIVAGPENKVIMIEAGGQEIKEEDMLEAIMAGQKEIQPAIDLIKEFKSNMPQQEKSNKKKIVDPEEEEAKKAKEEVLEEAKSWLEKNVEETLFNKEYYTKGERKGAVKKIKEDLNEHLYEKGTKKDHRKFAINSLVEKMVEEKVTEGILEKKKRVDGRTLTEIRDLKSEVNFLPRNHGSGLFSRGETQVMSIVTLGSPGMEQMLEGIEGASTKRYMHHYNFPPYSVGEAKPMRGVGRREVGHGALAEKALMPVLPSKEEFGYTIRVVSETLGSNGSSSMASTCASTLALMDAGVPLKNHVAGIAMGLASYEDLSKWEVLTDIQDLEDGNGGMDFKITGTENGLTAIQLDTKTKGINREIVEKTLTQGRQALNEVLNSLQEGIDKPKEELSPFAPRLINLAINPEKIGLVIGPGGKTINKIIDENDVTIDIEDEGKVIICGQNAENCEKAAEIVKSLTHEYKEGEITKGQVVKITDFGIFVKLGDGAQEGLVHISEMAPYRLGSASDLVKVGDEVTVKIKAIDEQGKLSLTMKGLDENQPFWEEGKGKVENQQGDRNNNRKPFNKNHN